MNSKFSLAGKLLVIVLLLAACGTAPTIIPSPTANPTPTNSPSPTPFMATITFENNECTYDGPQPIPAGPFLTVNWVIKDTARTKYGLYVFTLNEGKTKADLLAAANDPTPPAWASIAGSAESRPNTSQQMLVITQNGPLYFTCWSSPPESLFQIIGPIAVEGTTQAADPTPVSAGLTITFENHECTYAGPRPIPAGGEIASNAIIKDTDIPGPVPVVGITALTLNAGYTTQDVENDFRGTGGNIGVGVYETAGSVEVMAGQSKPFSVRTTKGPLYFVCFIDPMSENFFLIGPIEVSGANP